MPVGNILHIEVLAPARIHRSIDAWCTANDAEITATGLGVQYADIPTTEAADGNSTRLLFYWLQADRWEGRDFAVRVIANDEVRLDVARRDEWHRT